MMRFIGIKIIISVIFFASLRSAAQKNETVDTNAIDQLNLKAWKTKNTDLELSKKYASQAIVYAEKINYLRGLSYSYNVLGHYDKVKGHYNLAFYYYQKSLIIRQKLKDTIGIARSYKNLVSIYKVRGEYKKAIDNAIIAINLLSLKSHNNDAILEKANIQINLAALYLNTGDYKSAIKNTFEAKSIFINQNDDEGLASALMTLGNIYEMQGEYGKALIPLKEAIKLTTETDNQRELAKAYNNIGNVYYGLKQYPGALLNYKKGLVIRQLNGYDNDIVGSLYNMGLIYESFGQSDSAIKIYNQSLELSTISKNIEGQYEAYRAIGSALRDQKKHKESLGYFQKSLALSSTTSGLPEMLVLLKEISSTYRAFGESDSALVYSEKYTVLNDSLNYRLRSSEKFESAIKEKDYKLQIATAKNKTQTYVITILFLAIVLMAVIIFIFIKNSIAKKRTLQLQDLIKEQELLTVDAMIEGQETERKRLATELHDTIGSVLSAVKFSFKSMENSLVELLMENKTRYGKINDMLDEALGTVRRISHDMAAGVLEKGIGGALQQLCETLQETGKINIKLDMYGFEDKAESVTELNLYRIIQELLTNILKHANAQNVSIQLIKSKDNINLVVEDDGDGFDANQSQLKSGIGLKNINTRVKKLAGKWNIDSHKGKGTTAVVDIPINDINI